MPSFIFVFSLTCSFPQSFSSQFVSMLSFQLLGSKTSNSSFLIPPSRSQSPHPIHQQILSALFSENIQNLIPGPATCCFHGECLSLSCDPSLRTSLFSRFCSPIIRSLPDTVNHLRVIQSRGSSTQAFPCIPIRPKVKAGTVVKPFSFLYALQPPCLSLSPSDPGACTLPAQGHGFPVSST